MSAKFKLTQKFLGSLDRFILSPSWMSSGWWAVRRDQVESPDFTGIGEVGGAPLPSDIERRLGFKVGQVECHWREDDIIFEGLLPKVPVDDLERLERSDWAMTNGYDVSKSIDAILFVGVESQQSYFVDRRLVELFDIDELVQGGIAKALVDPQLRFSIAKRRGQLPRIAILDDRLFMMEDVLDIVEEIAKKELELPTADACRLRVKVNEEIGR